MILSIQQNVAANPKKNTLFAIRLWVKNRPEIEPFSMEPRTFKPAVQFLVTHFGRYTLFAIQHNECCSQQPKQTSLFATPRLRPTHSACTRAHSPYHKRPRSQTHSPAPPRPEFSCGQLGLSFSSPKCWLSSTLELGPQQKIICFAWLMEKKGTPEKAKNKQKGG